MALRGEDEVMDAVALLAWAVMDMPMADEDRELCVHLLAALAWVARAGNQATCPLPGLLETIRAERLTTN